MEKTITITLECLPDSATDGTGDDTAGHIIDPNDKPASNRIWQLAPGLALRLTLPDPAPVEVTGEEVKGFLMMEQLPNGDRGLGEGKSNGSWYGGLVILFNFATDPIGTFGGAVGEGIKNGSLP